MQPDEHVHIISAGGTIHTAYPALFRTLPSITRTVVFADSALYELSTNPEMERSRLAIRHAVDAVKEISASLSIPFTRETVFPPAYLSVRTIMITIHREFPGARFTFDLSDGSKPLCMALFSIAPWVGGEVYSAFDEKLPRRIPLPERSVRSMLENPNYQTILALLLRSGNQKPEVGTYRGVSREYLFKQLWSVYVPSRTKRAKPDDPPVPPVKYKRGITPAAELTHGTFSDFMKGLVEAGLVIQGISEDTARQKVYHITERGEIALRFFAVPETSTLVQTILERK